MNIRRFGTKVDGGPCGPKLYDETVGQAQKINFLKTKSAKQWTKVGTKAKSGLAVPLFSIYSKNSIGIGEIPDLKLLIDWCNKNSTPWHTKPQIHFSGIC